MIAQFYGWLDDSKVDALTREDLLFSVIGVVGAVAVLLLGYWAVSGFISWICGNKD